MDSPNISMRVRRRESLPAKHCSSGNNRNFNSSKVRYCDTSSASHCQSLPSSSLRRRNTTCNIGSPSTTKTTTTASVLIGRRLSATKHNPFVGSFRHSPPTSLRSMEATSSSLSSIAERIRNRTRTAAARAHSSIKGTCSSRLRRERSSSISSFFSSSSSSQSSSFPMVAGSSSSASAVVQLTTVASSSSSSKTKRRKNNFTVHKIDLDSLVEFDRWQDQLTSLLLGQGQQDSVGGSTSSPYYNTSLPITPKVPTLLTNVINGRLLGGSGKESPQNVQRQNYRYETTSGTNVDATASVNVNTVVSKVTSWLLYPLIYTFDDEEYYNDLFIDDDDDGNLQKTSTGLQFIGEDDDDDDNDNHNEDDSSSVGSSSTASTSSCVRDPMDTSYPFPTIIADDGDGDERKNDVEDIIRAETERELKEMNVSVSEIAEAYYAHKLIDQERRQSSSSSRNECYNNDNGRTNGLYPDIDELGADHRLDYEITQMDIARMTRNASRHLDVDSILTLPTVIYRKRQEEEPPRKKQEERDQTQEKKRKTKGTRKSKQTNRLFQWIDSSSSTASAAAEIIPASDQSYHHICTPIYEDRSGNDTSTDSSSTKSNDSDGSNNNEGGGTQEEDGWSFLMVNGVKSKVYQNSTTASSSPSPRQRKTKSKSNDDASTIRGKKTNDDNTAAAAYDNYIGDKNNHPYATEGTSKSMAASDNDICVICLEAFQDGDRLRVLPCNHSFHVGCIDRWLSGSYSYNECYTAGCPTCKKLPAMKTTKLAPVRAAATNIVTDEDKGSNDDDHGEMTGSVPSWAFAKLGSAMMAMSSADVPECNTADADIDSKREQGKSN